PSSADADSLRRHRIAPCPLRQDSACRGPEEWSSCPPRSCPLGRPPPPPKTRWSPRYTGSSVRVHSSTPSASPPSPVAQAPRTSSPYPSTPKSMLSVNKSFGYCGVEMFHISELSPRESRAVEILQSSKGLGPAS